MSFTTLYTYIFLYIPIHSTIINTIKTFICIFSYIYAIINTLYYLFNLISISHILWTRLNTLISLILNNKITTINTVRFIIYRLSIAFWTIILTLLIPNNIIFWTLINTIIRWIIIYVKFFYFAWRGKIFLSIFNFIVSNTFANNTYIWFFSI